MSHIGEMAFAIASVERETGADQKDVQVAVVVVVEEGAAVPDPLEDVNGTRAGDVPAIAQPISCRDINKRNRAPGVDKGWERLILNRRARWWHRLRRRGRTKSTTEQQ